MVTGLDKWDSYFKILADTTTPLKLKRKIIELAPKNFIVQIVDICLNVHKNSSIPLQPKTLALIKQHKTVGLGLSNLKRSIQSKRNLLKSKKGINFLEKLLPVLLLEIEQTELETEPKETLL